MSNHSLISTDSTLSFHKIQITPYRIQHTITGQKIYEFWRGDPKSKNPKEFAMIVIHKGEKNFNLHYYPVDAKDLQVVENLPIDKLFEAAENLKSAGFI